MNSGSADKLSSAQSGHIRHMKNLAAQLPDDWSGMMGKSTLQEDFGAYRFQLAYMSYALALAHIHRLPAAPGYFKKTFQKLIEKVLSPDVWTYWHYVSTGNGPLNKSLGELPAEWNPVIRDNIMYSAYVQSMALLYHYLFGDQRYAQKGALSMVMKPLFWGSEKRFEYDENSLNDHIYWSMVERGYLGIACEPNCVFQICNQVPILGFRFHDLVYGGSTADEVTQGYLKAWSEFGIVNDDGHFSVVLMEKERTLVPRAAPWSDFWLGALMHAWNPALVEENYQKQIARWARPGPDGALWVAPPEQAPFKSALDFGWAAVCASEVGDADTLERLLAYADRFLHPRWKAGGLYYQRHDELYNSDGLFTAMDPHTGNCLLGYARLNIPNGLRSLYERKLPEERFNEPAISDLSDTLDVLQARYDRDEKRLRITLIDQEPDKDTELEIANAGNATSWAMIIDGEAAASCDGSSIKLFGSAIGVQHADGDLKIRLRVKGETDMEIIWR